MLEKSLSELDFAQLTKRTFFPSPAAWEDHALYFLMLDRFSDNKESDYKDNAGNRVNDGTTPLFKMADAGNAIQTEADAMAWKNAGGRWCGGTLKGLTNKIGYLKRLGISAIWVSPIFKQISFQETYHGYGVQNFIDVDPHFGSRDDLKKLVDAAHKNGIYVILDIILNHAGNIFSYSPDRYRVTTHGQDFFDPRWDNNGYNVKGFNDKHGQPNLPFNLLDSTQRQSAWPDGAIWPSEFQNPAFYTQKGRIDNWDYDPEFREGDFFDLKDIHLGSGHIDSYQPSAALMALCDAYKFWIAFADIDGFRVDTVKHMDSGATRFFTAVIHEFAECIGKENFYLIGEITGGRQRAFTTLEETGLNAALGIDDIPDKLEYLVKGYRNPGEYFDLFRNSLLVQKESHVWFKDKVVTLFDDHDQVRKGQSKARFCAEGETAQKLALNVLALNCTTLGIPCIYYGTEQRFDGAGDNDRYIRETMFGGSFGAFRSRGRHFFNEDTDLYRELAKILALRRKTIALRRGRQYLRQISGNGMDFGLPHMIGNEIRSIVPWSRLFNDHEILLAINTDPFNERSAWSIVDNDLHRLGDTLKCLYSTDANQIGKTIEINEPKPNTKTVKLSVPAAGFVIFE